MVPENVRHIKNKIGDRITNMKMLVGKGEEGKDIAYFNRNYKKGII